jgi:hypothetical protein
LDKGIGTPQPIAFLENLIGWFARQLLCKWASCCRINFQGTRGNSDWIRIFFDNSRFFFFRLTWKGWVYGPFSGNTLIKSIRKSVSVLSGWFKQNEFSWIDGFWYANENLSKLTPKGDDAIWVMRYAKCYSETSSRTFEKNVGEH